VDDRITGNITVIDQSGDITRSNVAFQAVAAPNQVSSQYAFCQLWNPTAGKVLEIRRIQVTTSAATGTIFLHFDTGALASSTNAINRNYGGTAPGAQSRYSNAAAAPGTLGAIVAAANVAAGQIYTFDFVEPIILPQNIGITVFANTLNTASVAVFFGREVNA
jgi:subtilisin family serine protease